LLKRRKKTRRWKKIGRISCGDRGGRRGGGGKYQMRKEEEEEK